MKDGANAFCWTSRGINRIPHVKLKPPKTAASLPPDQEPRNRAERRAAKARLRLERKEVDT
jgi:hypothetical protein